jgi:hypothetical protein
MLAEGKINKLKTDIFSGKIYFQIYNYLEKIALSIELVQYDDDFLALNYFTWHKYASTEIFHLKKIYTIGDNLLYVHVCVNLTHDI